MTLHETHTPAMSDTLAETTTVTVWLIRHAKVVSHQGDQPLTDDSLEPVETTARQIEAAMAPGQTISFHSTRTMRSQDTATALRARIAPDAPDLGPTWGLRNPDIYLHGQRVEMVSTANAYEAQLTQLATDFTAADVLAHPFYKGFLTAPDRIEYWLTHATPPGEASADVAARVAHFVQSLPRPGTGHHHAVCVTHSPVMRAVLVALLGLSDPGEPEWVEAITLDVTDGIIRGRFRDQTVTCLPMT